MKRRYRTVIGCVIGVFLIGTNGYSADSPASPADATLEQQREYFLQAREAISRGDDSRFRQLAAELTDYPLLPYLQYADLRRSLDEADAAQRVTQFRQRYPNLAITPWLQSAWLEYLAARGDWSLFLEHYQPMGRELACWRLQGLAATQSEQFVPAARELWLVGYSQPQVCDKPFKALIDGGHLRSEDAMARIALAMESGNRTLARFLRRYLTRADRQRADAWLRMHSNPERELTRLMADASSEWRGRLAAYGFERLARLDAEKADRYWHSHKATLTLPDEAVARIERRIALGLATDYHPYAVERLAALPTEWHNSSTREWRVRIALRQKDWEAVLVALDALSEPEQLEPQWRYWRARAEYELGNTLLARALYRRTAECRCYYGFLAAERAGVAPAIENQPTAVTAEQITALAELAAAQRAKELHAVGMEVYARREWRDLIETLSQSELLAAAKLADSWSWHDQAIVAFAKAGYYDDLESRFPLPYRDFVTTAATERHLDEAFVYAVMRQESAFYARARSSAGALGLMQLMPATARHAARKSNARLAGRHQILDVDTNISLGTAYLRELLDRYQGNRFYTMAAYNAGPHRVAKWLPKDGVLPGDIWVETMPYSETREYVKRIFAYTFIYQWRLGEEPTPVSAYLPDSHPPETLTLSSDSDHTG